MPQRIEVPGIGVVEFPDNMTDEQIVSAIQANVQPTETPKAAPPAPTTMPGFAGPIPAQAGPTEEAMLSRGMAEKAGRFTPRFAGGLLNLPEGLAQTASLAMETAGKQLIMGDEKIGTALNCIFSKEI